MQRPRPQLVTRGPPTALRKRGEPPEGPSADFADDADSGPRPAVRRWQLVTGHWKPAVQPRVIWDLVFGVWDFPRRAGYLQSGVFQRGPIRLQTSEFFCWKPALSRPARQSRIFNLESRMYWLVTRAAGAAGTQEIGRCPDFF
jgi:hypothetical protein